jgi:hypothetical protein
MTGVGQRGKTMSNERISAEDPQRTAGAPPACHHAGGRHGRGMGSRTIALIFLGLSCLALLAAAAGCGGEAPDTRPQEVQVAERALQAALGGEKIEFVGLVAPSFLAQARAEMPDTDDETLGGVLIAGFLEDIPFAGIVEPQYSYFDYEYEIRPKAATYVWGRFIDAAGNEVVIDEADAIRIPLVYEDGRFYLDLLDL